MEDPVGKTESVMKIKDYAITKHRNCRDSWKMKAQQAFILDLPDVVVLTSVNRANREHRQVKILLQRRKHVQTSTFNLNAYSEQQCLRDFRFKATDIGRLAFRLAFPGRTSRNDYICDSVCATCILLHRLATVIRWYDVEPKFGFFSSQLSELFWDMVDLLIERVGHLLDLRGAFLRSRAALYASAIKDAGAPLERCVGFVDCTKIRMSRPGGGGANQRSCYSGHKRMHCLIYQSLTTPDGLIFAMFGPEVGRRHDITLYRNSGWDDLFEEFLLVDGQYFCVYGDSAYLLRPWMQRPYYRDLATPLQMLFNTRMSVVRVSVEHNYKDLKQFWVRQDFARQLQVRKAPIALLYKASALLLNMHACLYTRGQVAEQFQLDPPPLEQYLEAV